MRKCFILFVLLLPLLFSTGCWDQVELDKMGYVLCIGIDEYDEDTATVASRRDETAPMYNFEFEISRLQGSQGNGMGGDQENRFLITVGSHSIPEAIDLLETTLENPATLTHLQAVIIGEPVARKGIKQMIDYLLRDPDVRRMTFLFVAEGLASDIMAFEPQISETVGEYLNDLTRNAPETSLSLVQDDLGVISYNLANQLDFLVPRVYKIRDRVLCKGAAVLSREGRLIDWVVEHDVFEGARFIRGLYREGNVSVTCPLTNSTVVVRIKKANTKIRTFRDMSVILEVSVVGNIKTNLGGRVVLDEDYISKINTGVEREVRQRIEKALQYFQGDLKADVFFMNMKFRQYHYQEWKERNVNWPDAFSNLDVEVKVHARLQHAGTITSID